MVKFGEKMSSLMEGFTPKQLLMMAGVAGLLTFAVLYWGLSRLVGSEEKQEQTQQPTMQMVKVVQAKTDIKAREQLYQSVKDSGFTGVIPPDRRAMSVAVTDVTGVSGFLKPGDYVDVMFITEKMDSTRITGEVILQNVLLLGVNNTAERTDGNQQQETKSGSDLKGKLDNAFSGEKPMTATLAVRPEEELRLAVAARAGQIYLALRPYKPANMYMLDTEYSFFKGRATQTAPPAATPVPQAPAPASSGFGSDPGGQMEIIRGTQASRGK